MVVSRHGKHQANLKMKGSKTMGTTPNAVATDQVKKTPEPIKVEKTYKYFDLATFDEIEEKAEVTFTPAADYAEALSRVNNDQAIVTKALNAYLQRAAFTEKRREIGSKGASRKVVLSVIKPFRSLPPWDAIEDRKEQTKKLLEMVKASPIIVESIKAASLKAAEAGEDDDDNESEE